MSSAVPKGHGFMVVTKIVPLEEDCDIPMTNVISEVKKPNIHDPKVPEMTRVFQKGYPMNLGIVQIFLGLMFVALGVLGILSTFLFFGEIPLCLGIFVILSGSISAAANKGKRVCQIKGTLAINIISSLLSVTAIGYFCWELTNQLRVECTDDDYNWKCWSTVFRYKAVVNGMKGLLLVMAVFEVCVATTISVFSAKAIRHSADHLVGNPGAPAGACIASDSTAALLTAEDLAPESP